MIVFDLDNTLRCVKCADHLVPADISRTENWLPWQDHVNSNGQPIDKNVFLYKFAHDIYGGNQQIVLVTSSQHGSGTWLKNHNLPTPDLIVERGADDHLSPYAYKKKFIDEFKEAIRVWVDDSESVCAYAESLGLQVLKV